MNDAVAELEAAIAASPGAPEPYLVLADHLQARGEPRGELISVQHALDGARGADRDRLLGRERWLLEQLGLPRSQSFRWKWGFVQTAHLSGTLGPILSALEHPCLSLVRELSVLLELPAGFQPIVAALEGEPRPLLSMLTVGRLFSYEGLSAFVREEARVPTDEEALAPVFERRAAPSLKDLTLWSLRVSRAFCDRLPAAPVLRGLTRLHLRSGWIDLRGTATVDFLGMIERHAAAFEHLEKLSVGVMDYLRDDLVVRLAARLPNLELYEAAQIT